MDQAKTCTATFTLNQHSLTVNTAGNGTGAVDGGGTYDYGSTNQVTAVADSGSTFTGWSGNCIGTVSPYDVTMPDADIICTATFTLNQHVLTVNNTGTSSGTVGGGGIYDYGSIQQVTALANAGSTFTGWVGDCSNTASPSSVTMLDRDISLYCYVYVEFVYDNVNFWLKRKHYLLSDPNELWLELNLYN